MSNENSVNRRDFLRTASVAGSLTGLAGSAFAARPAKTGRVIGANDKINVGVIGCGGRGTGVATIFDRVGQKDGSCRIAAVCDVYEKRKKMNADKYGVKGYLDYRELLDKEDVDAVLVATPDHWHATIALAAMDARQGRLPREADVPHHRRGKASGRHGQGNEARPAGRLADDLGRSVAQGKEGDRRRHARPDADEPGLIPPQLQRRRVELADRCRRRSRRQGRGLHRLEDVARTGAEAHLGSRPILPLPKILGLLRRHRDRPLLSRRRAHEHLLGRAAVSLEVMADGGIFVFKNRPENPSLPDREVPDTFSLIGTYAKGHQLVLSSSMANSQHIPGLIRGHEASLIMVEHGRFEGYSPQITVRPERKVISDEYKQKWGEEDIKIPVEENNTMQAHIRNFLRCMHTRQKPTLDVETGARAQVLITMAVQSYREGRVLYFDEKTWKVSPKAFKA